EVFFFQAEDGIRALIVTGVQTCALPISLNSSKITVSPADPVSTRAVARMVSEPPFSMLRAAPRKRFGGYSAVESTPPDRMRPERSEERRVGKEGREGWGAAHYKKIRERR